MSPASGALPKQNRGAVETQNLREEHWSLSAQHLFHMAEIHPSTARRPALPRRLASCLQQDGRYSGLRYLAVYGADDCPAPNPWSNLSSIERREAGRLGGGHGKGHPIPQFAEATARTARLPRDDTIAAG